MPAYMIFLREQPVADRAELALYSQANHAAADEFRTLYGIRPLVVYGATEALEGNAPDGIVLLEFPTADDARAWYDSPQYQAALIHRKLAADYRALIVEGL